MGRRVGDRDDRLVRLAAFNQERLERAYLERFGPGAVAPQIHPSPPAVQSATLPNDRTTDDTDERSTTP